MLGHRESGHLPMCKLVSCRASLFRGSPSALGDGRSDPPFRALRTATGSSLRDIPASGGRSYEFIPAGRLPLRTGGFAMTPRALAWAAFGAVAVLARWRFWPWARSRGGACAGPGRGLRSGAVLGVLAVGLGLAGGRRRRRRLFRLVGLGCVGAARQPRRCPRHAPRVAAQRPGGRARHRSSESSTTRWIPSRSSGRRG